MNIVDLPAPFGPMTAWMVPGATVNETSESAVMAPNRTRDVVDLDLRDVGPDVGGGGHGVHRDRVRCVAGPAASAAGSSLSCPR